MMNAPLSWEHVRNLSMHHLYYLQDYFENLVHKRATLQAQLMWGFTNLALDLSGIAAGRIGLGMAAGMMPDGTSFSMPDQHQLPLAVTIKQDSQENNEDVMVYFAILNKQSVEKQRSERYYVHNQNMDGKDFLTLKPKFTLIVGKKNIINYTTLPIARIKQILPNGTLLLDENFLFPVYHIHNSPSLILKIKNIYSTVQLAARSLAERCVLSVQSGNQLGATHIDSELLGVYNHFQLYLQRVLKDPYLHPQDVYYQLTQFYGLLSTYLNQDKVPKEIEAYNHDNMAFVFADIIDELHRQFMTPLDLSAKQCELKVGPLSAYYSQDLKAHVLLNFYFILVVSADVPMENIKRYLPGQCKISAPSEIDEHIRSMSTAVKLIPLPAVPPHIPYYHGATYFEIPQDEEFRNAWEIIDAEGQIAIHITGDYPGLRMQLWLIKKDRVKL
jgi:type VI secretion system protein ImpJ